MAPDLPATQGVQPPAPVRLYCPAAHCVAVGVDDPRGHAYPAVHDPVHPAVARLEVDPYRPAAQLVQPTALPVLYVPTAHTFVHVATVRPAVAPYLPATQGVHVPAVARL